MAGNDLLTRLIFEAEDRASSVITKIGTALATYFAVDKISGFFSSAVKGASDLEKQFSTLQAATGATGEDIAKLKAKAEELGASDALSVSALQAAQAMTELGRAGQSTEQILQSITPVIALAQGASLDLGEAANIVTANLAGFQLSADQAGRVADVLSTAASSAKTTVRQLADALSYAAPAANAAGMSIEETTAIIAKMQNAGIDGTRAGTALNAMLTSLADPASTASKALDQAGISTRSFSEVLAKLEQGGPAAKEAIVAFGTEAGPALRALLAQGSASIQELKTSLENASGSAEKAAATMNDNLAGAFEALGSVWDGLKTSLVQPLLEPLEQQARSLAASLANFSQSAQMEQLKAVLVSTFETGAAQLRAFASAINWPAFAQSVSDGLNSALTSLKSWAENIGTVKDSVVLAFSAIGTGISTVQAAFFGLAGAAATAISSMLNGFAWLREQAANVAFGPLKTMLEDSAANYRAVAESFRVSAEENFGKASEALAQAAERGETLREAWSRLNEPAQQVAANVSALGTAQEGTTQKSAELIEAERELELALAAYNAALAQAQAGQDTTGTSLITLGQAVIAAQDKVNALTSAATQAAPALDAVGQAATATGTSAEQASQQIAELENAYQAFLAIGDTQSAAQIRQQIEDIRDSLQQVPDASEAAASAFRTLNITSQAELRRIAETAKSAFETIERSGTATLVDIQNAFKAYATAAIAANNGVADSTIETKAAQLGLAVVATETGDKIVTASEAAAQSVYGVAQAAAAAKEAMAE
ncbi:MAG: phage tail tape measure protein, partial [Candidatus Roseilinea sp.]|uniref:phage tail tape measure protein n=1 Tax=Candidatus Roseilinea sp. TaxID=2838777 RepID=UPI004049E378